jgi:hypothetical protein
LPGIYSDAQKLPTLDLLTFKGKITLSKKGKLKDENKFGFTATI